MTSAISLAPPSSTRSATQPLLPSGSRPSVESLVLQIPLVILEVCHPISFGRFPHSWGTKRRSVLLMNVYCLIGFAIKIRTQEGNLDWVFNNTPVFFLRDPSKFPHFIHTQKRDPQTHLKDADMFWVRFPTRYLAIALSPLTNFTIFGTLGLSLTKPRVGSPSDDPVLRPWNSRWLPQYAWILGAHFQIC